MKPATLVAVVATTALCVTSAHAQTIPRGDPAAPPGQSGLTPQDEIPVVERRPFRGLFAGNEARPGGDGLTLSLSGFGGYDDNVIASEASNTGRVPVAGSYVGGNGRMTYGVSRRGVVFTAIGATDLRYYRSDAAPQSGDHTAILAVSVPVGRNFVLAARQGFRISPYYQLTTGLTLPSYGPGSGLEAPIPTYDDSLFATDMLGFDTDLTLTQQAGRSELRYSYGYRGNNFSQAELQSRMHTAGVEFSRRVSRYGTLRLGYGVRQPRYASNPGRDALLQDLLLGGDYARPLSFSRRTTVSFSGGTALSNVHDERRYRVIADASVHHEVGRTWMVRGVYQQGVQVIDIFADPLYGYTARLSVGGLIGERLELDIEGGYSDGNYDNAREANGYAAYQGSARLRWALSESVAAYSEYSYHQYGFDEIPTLPTTLGTGYQRHAVRLGVSLWWPLIEGRRQANAAR